jgi:phenylalanyl-tRNA synthetase beta subunit
MASAPLNDVRCTDVYKDSKLSEAGKQAWLIRLRFQSIDRTLTGEEVEAWVALAIDAVAVLGVILRG